MTSLVTSRLFALIVISICLALSLSAWAQRDTGSIVGTISDQSGALISNAKVQVTDIERGIAFDATTNASGEYVARPLRVGRNTVTIEHPGVKKAVSAPVSLDVQQRIKKLRNERKNPPA